MEPQGRLRPRVLQCEVGGQPPLGDILHSVVLVLGCVPPDGCLQQGSWSQAVFTE